MFSCLWQIWEWIDPNKMDKVKKFQGFENASATNQNIPNNDSNLQQIHQHSTAPHYYPMVHQHPQMYNNSHPHPIQSPLLLNINNQQVLHTTVHRHFQHYPQYGVNINSNEYVHQHMPRSNPQPPSQINNPLRTPQQHMETSNNNTISQGGFPPETPKQELSKDAQVKALTPKSRAKEAEKKQLRSPSARRPANAPVAFQGWLHKQGSEGLMLWKKRWFVLSEYCLFYYKGLQEEKVLGSILLPSYKVSVCGPDDKINRKFAFKCEHANMRTYILAADSQDLMMQWIHVLNLACNLQNNLEPSKEQQMAQSAEPNSYKSNTPAGQINAFYGNHMKASHVHEHTSSNITDLSNSSQQELSQCNQPLYANAPPKPRRLTDGYCSPGPEILETYSSYQGSRCDAKSPSNAYRRSLNPHEYIYSDRLFLGPQNVDRRTPDTYGRSNLTKYRNPSDYEDVYTEQSAYKRPLSPVAADNVLKKGYPTVNVGYPVVKGYAPPPIDMTLKPHYSAAVSMRRTPVPTISRPHSADFLEYKPYKIETVPSAAPVSQQARPKSSLDINMYSKDCGPVTRSNSYYVDSQELQRDNDYFYSQETYAEKMRKSAQYLQKMPVNYHPVDSSHRQHRDRYNLDMPNSYTYNQPFREQEAKLQPVRSRSALSEGSLLCAQDIENDTISRDYVLGPEQTLGVVKNAAQDQFTRSASARLSQNNAFEENVTRIEGERKREESMKRLLEWKQRMLQSPLNRKAQAQAYRGYPVGKENPQLLQNYNSDKKQKKSSITNRRSVHNLVQYNSYSSDDEENGEKSSKHTQAGRTMDTFPNNSDSLTHASLTSTTALNPPDEPATSTSIPTNQEDALPEPSLAQISISEEFTDSIITTDIRSSGALVQAILSEFQSPAVKKQPILEGNYVPMSPKISVLQSNCDTDTLPGLGNDSEENHYVEMTRTIDSVLMESTNDFDCNDQQQYEMVCFSGEKIEPVYMEVPEGTQQDNATGHNELPDILKSPTCQQTQENKSDSSDADDEASKDLDLSENPNHHRFSLSDTFRPASYYLGVSKTIPEFQDSSDSELVSPPPIPASSPPLDDDDYIPIRSTKERRNVTVPRRNSDQFFNNTPPAKEDKGSSDVRSSFLSLRDLKGPDTSLECHDTLSRLSSNSGSISSLTANSRMPVSEDFSTPTEYGEVQDIKSVEKYFERLKLTEEARLSTLGEDGHAYENFLIAKNSMRPDFAEVSNNANPVKKRFASPSSIPDDCRPRCRPESSCSVSAEISSFFVNSNRSTPVIGGMDVSDPQLDAPQIVPYYYSDLSGTISSLENSLTLNNQRESINGSKRDITRIINPIKCNRHEESSLDDHFPNVLAAEARSVSVDFLNLTDKSGSIDKKNIYESDTLKRHKSQDAQPLTNCLQSRNLFLNRKTNKYHQETSNENMVRKSYSLEGLLENVLNENTVHDSTNRENSVSEGSFLWEEDSVWREQLRSVSQRHTKSMDDLDTIDVDQDSIHKKPTRAITREVTYVNDILFKSNDSGTKKAAKSKVEIKKKGSFLIDRETLRQWDLMSSAPSDDQLVKMGDRQGTQVHVVVDSCESSTDTGDIGNCQETASGSISISTKDAALGRDTFPRVVNAKGCVTPTIQTMQARSVTNLDRTAYKYDNISNYSSRNQPQCMYERDQEFRTSQNELIPKTKMNVSAGELLGRTHEELVLLLIQLRRQQAQTFQAIESCYNEIDSLQIHIHNVDQMKRMENLHKLERIKQNLLELEKQYEKRKPLVNLVDNMVKLGSLYRNPNERTDIARHIREKLEFNQYVQERRLLADEKRDWNRIEPSHVQLQQKVRQLYQLDGLIQEESRNLHNLQRDKEDIERALGGLRNRLLKGLNNPEEIEQARRQQFMLENELSRVHLMLAQNSKKLEETVAGNARLEQELLVLKQKLQSSRQQRSSPQFSNAGDSIPYMSGSNQALETNLERVQKKIGDLQKQREELSLQVRQLTDRSSTPHSHQSKHSSPIDQQAFNSNNYKKRPTSSWRETDLDTMNSIDHGYDSYSSTSTTPLYINTDIKPLGSSEFQDRNLKTSDSTSDDTALSLNPLEKQEIKTVRIVKRESERRQRDREKTFNGKCDPLMEEDDSSQGSSVLFRPTSLPHALHFEHHSLPGRSNKQKPAELSPVFKSEAAKQIITEVSKKSPTVQGQRRAVPKEHRRHHTAPHDNLVMLGTLEGRRARDDLDIERALRQRIDAPDLVRSTLSNKDLKYNEETIDNILSTPNKILIPERYIPEQMPQPSVEEQEKRNKKVESIKKMLSDTAIISAPVASMQNSNKSQDKKLNTGGKSASTSSISEEKKQREHLLQLNQILAKQVMEMSKAVAVKNLQALKLTPQPVSTEEEDSSPVTPLPLYQQRENYYS
ncbi:uncharacterized protein LOC109541025 [Dendroctonus ponderosae]|uniref:uncharacterized protein LOC109541025 n=1 Tax=Dendroctonus ponderosae TaxID=77166 RepID=UPI0020354952|nr:uncharacterized protein LOC109541025 [Dendroctonus ponderosae]